MRDIVDRCFEHHLALLEKVRGQLGDDIVGAAKKIISCLENHHKLLICGNGGSAADAQHIAAEFTGRYLLPNRRPLPAIALTTDSSALTAIGNDFGFDRIFARQILALGEEGDVLLALSTSGNSPNVIEAINTARAVGCSVIALTGRDGGRMKNLADLNLIVPSDETPHIQEMHITIAHILCDLVDRSFAE